MSYECEEPGCEATIEKPSKWVMIKAHAAGWYQQKNGKVWCPKHRPPWAPDKWR